MRCEKQQSIRAVGSPMDGSKRRRVSPHEQDQSVTDAEVEEFYAILRRIRPLTKHPPPVQPQPATWNPSFTPEDFAVRKDDRRTEAVQSGGRAPVVTRNFDLNEDPEPEAVRAPLVR